MANTIINQWFGVVALFWPWFLIRAGIQLIHPIGRYNLPKKLINLFFITIWGSVATAFVIPTISVAPYIQLGGNHGNEIVKYLSTLIGNIGLNDVGPRDKQAEIGICINPLYWGNDIATELTKNSLRYGFEYLKLEKLIAVTYEDNMKTRKSLESLGFKYIRSYNKKIITIIGFKNITCHRYELLRRDYILGKYL